MDKEQGHYTQVGGIGNSIELIHPENEYARACGATEEIAYLLMRLLEIKMGLTYIQEGANYDRDAVIARLTRLTLLMPDE